MVLVGKLFVDSAVYMGKKIYLYQNNEQGRSILKDSAIADANGQYEFNIRPNKHRSPINFFISLLSALIAYQIKPHKPKINLKHFSIPYP